MKKPVDFYRKYVEDYSENLKVIQQKLLRSSVMRIAAFLLTIVGIYFSFGNIFAVIGVVLGAVILFIYLVIRHNQLKYERDLFQNLILQNEIELQVMEGRFDDLPTGEEYADGMHAFSEDIDLFGKKSFYQYLNRTALKEGSDLLANLLLANEIDNIPEKQEAVKNLASRPEWRQKFSAIASLVKTEKCSDDIVRWLNSYKAFIPKMMYKLSLLFSVVSAVLLIAYFADFIKGYFVAGWFFIGLIISGRFLKNVNALSTDTSGIQGTFQQFQKLISEIEETDFDAALLKRKRQQIIHSENKASAILKKFARHLDALDQRGNMLFGILGNGFLLWDIQQGYKIEQWIEENKQNVSNWFKTIVFFDSYNSLGNFVFNHPHYVFPELMDQGNILDANDAGHPLLNEEVMVRNDFRIAPEEFFIITGANMAGKSTFLRTVSLLIVMGNMGLPVCATRAKYQPIKLITSMRTTDSLSSDESYFFSELKRLKFIVDSIEKDNYFIILDEILKGTNSTDKAIGSKKFVEKLVRSHSTGIIATHDLSLCEIAETLPDVKNFYFDAQIINDELFFDYTFKPGICRNMNASFLLKKMKIVD